MKLDITIKVCPIALGETVKTLAVDLRNYLHELYGEESGDYLPDYDTIGPLLQDYVEVLGEVALDQLQDFVREQSGVESPTDIEQKVIDYVAEQIYENILIYQPIGE